MTTTPDGHAQELRALASDPSCACGIVLRRVARLGRPEDTVSISARSVVARDTRGRFFATPVYPPGIVAVLDSSGRQVAAFGRAGRGPGELGAIRHVRVTTGDSIVVLDRERVTLFGPEGAFVRAASVPPGLVGFRFAVLADGRLLVNNYFPTRRNLTLLDSRYREVRTFGTSIAGDRAPDSDRLQVMLAPIDSGRIIAVKQNYEYLIQIWDTAGVLRKEFRPAAEWFPPWSREERRERGQASAPFPAILGVHANLQGRQLWIAAVVADRRRRSPATTQRRGEQPAAMIDPADYTRAYDTIIEVLDLESGRIQVSQRFDAYVPSFMEGGFLYGLTEESTGLYVVDVWRPEVVPQR